MKKQTTSRNGIEFTFPASFANLEAYAEYIYQQLEKARNLKLATQISSYEITVSKLQKAGLSNQLNLA